MYKARSQKGFSLTELLTVVAVMALLIGISVPASKALMDSVNSSSGMRTIIASALANARATAIQKQKYAGVRFQSDTEGNQYLVFIISDEAAEPSTSDISFDPEITGTGLANGFRAVRGHKPIKLPGDGRVMDLKLREYGTRQSAGAAGEKDPTYYNIADETNNGDGDATDDFCSPTNFKYSIEYMDTTTFAIVFSPAGKLVSHQVRIRNRHGRIDSSSYTSPDKVFNIKTLVESGDALLCQDDYPDFYTKTHDGYGLGQEYSRKSFYIFDKTKFDLYGTNGDWVNLWNNYFSYLEPIYINPITGELVGG